MSTESPTPSPAVAAPEPLLVWLCRILGCFFALTGALKVPAFPQLMDSVHQVIATGPALSSMAAFGIIMCEIGAGVMLARRVEPRIAAIALAGLTSSFLWVLLVRIMLNKPFVCHCFGILPFQLKLEWEFILDVLLFNLLATVALCWPARGWWRNLPPRALVFTTTMLICIGVVECAMVLSAVRAASEREREWDLAPAINYAAEVRGIHPSTFKNRRVVFLLDWPDFHCPLCFEDFITIADSLREAKGGVHPTPAAIALMRQTGAEPFDDERHLNEWGVESKIPFRMLISPDSLFRVLDFHKSMVAVVDSADNVLLAGEFPMGQERRKAILDLVIH